MRIIFLLSLWLASLALSAAAEATEKRYYIVNNSTVWTVRAQQLSWIGPDIGPGQRADYAPGSMGRVQVYYRERDGERWFRTGGIDGSHQCLADPSTFGEVCHVIFVIGNSTMVDHGPWHLSVWCVTINAP